MGLFRKLADRAFEPLTPVIEWVLGKHVRRESTLKEAHAAMRKLQSRVDKDYPDCVALGWGLEDATKDDSDYIVIAQFLGKVPENFPDKIDGVTVSSIELGIR